jgi:transcription initiation factor TFIIIB Brf1 subunit/transcription initiation factor TFIIB
MEKFLFAAYTKIDFLYGSYMIPSHTRALAKKAFRQLCCIGRSHQYISNSTLSLFVGASVFMAADQFDAKLDIAEIARLLSLPINRLTNALWLLEELILFRQGSGEVVRLASKYCGDLGQTGEFTGMVTELAAKAHDCETLVEGARLFGDPKVLACCSLVMVGHIQRNYTSVRRIARVAGIDEESIRDGCMLLLDMRTELLNIEWVNPWPDVELSADVKFYGGSIDDWFGVD